MYKFLVQLFRLLLPIVRQTVADVAADTITRMAYPDRRRGSYPRPYATRTNYDRLFDLKRPRNATEQDAFERARIQNLQRNPRFSTDSRFHDVLMVAFDITGPNAGVVHEWLENHMPRATTYASHDINLDSWWIADDNSYDDRDSAVFVRKGEQTLARQLLLANDLVDD